MINTFKVGLIEEISLLKSNLRVAVDSCSLIYLNRLNVLKTYTCVHEIVLTKELYDEITSLPSNRAVFDDIRVYKELFADKLLHINGAKTACVNPIGNMSAADESIVHACMILNLDGIITDDKELCLYCRSSGIAYLNTPMVLFSLLYNKHLTHHQYKFKLKKLYSIGRYGVFVYRYMQELYDEYCRSIAMGKECV